MLTRARKEQEVASLSEKLGQAKAAFIVDYKGLNVEQITNLRKKLYPIQTEMKVVRNTLARRALKDHPDLDGLLSDQFEGPNAIVFAYEDPSACAKALTEFSKQADVLEMKTGAMDGQLLDEGQIKYLATLPSQDELRSQLLATIKAPMQKFVRTLNEVPSGFVRVLQAYKETKQ